MELGYSTIALLFPAIPLMFLVYSNTSTAVGARLRELFEAVSRGDVTGDEYNRVSEEAEYLAKRLSLLRFRSDAVRVNFSVQFTNSSQYLFGTTSVCPIPIWVRRHYNDAFYTPLLDGNIRNC